MKYLLHRKCNVFLSLILTIFFILVLLLPTFLGRYHVYLVCEVMVTGLLAYSVYFLLSYGGLINFGISAYQGVAAYTVAILLTQGITSSFWLSILAGVASAAFLALVIGWFCAKRRGIYFALLTLAFSETVHAVIFKWRSLTGGNDGVPNVPRPPISFIFFDLSIKSIGNYYYVILFLLIIALVVIGMVSRSNFGYTLRSVRDNPDRASFIGLNVQRRVWIAFIFSGAVAGLAGTLRVFLVQIASPELVSWMGSIEALLALMIGGISAFSGPLVGATIYVFLKSYLISLWGNWVIVMGILLIVAVLLFRNGVMGFVSKKLEIPL